MQASVSVTDDSCHITHITPAKTTTTVTHGDHRDIGHSTTKPIKRIKKEK